MENDREKMGEYYRAKMDRQGVPKRMQGSLERYIVDGSANCGSFVQAVLSDSLSRAMRNADSENLSLLRNYVMFLYNDAPIGCWGSEENVDNWVANGGLMGKESREVS